MFTNADNALQQYAGWLMSDMPAEVHSRNGVCREDILCNFRLVRPLERELVNPERKASIAAQIAETAWVLAGRNDVEFLSHYLPRAKDFSDDGFSWRAGYGPRLRHWGTDGVDQIKEVVDRLQEDPDTRRAVMTLWNPSWDNVESRDLPCNNWLSFLIRNDHLHMNVATRSNDLIWGWSGINQFEWSVLQELIASMVGVEVGYCDYTITSLHVYEHHYDRARKIQDAHFAVDDPEDRRRFRTHIRSMEELDENLEVFFHCEAKIRAGQRLTTEDRETENYGIVDNLFFSWIHVLQWYWTGSTQPLAKIWDTRLEEACRVSKPHKSAMATPEVAPGQDRLIDHLCELHREKHEVYGDSWKKRGVKLGIMANVARKIDRLGRPGAGDTDVDTAEDLLIYLVKFRWWLVDEGKEREPSIPVSDLQIPYSDHHAPVERYLRRFFGRTPEWAKIKSTQDLESMARNNFDLMWDRVEREDYDGLMPALFASMYIAMELVRRYDEAAQKKVWSR